MVIEVFGPMLYSTGTDLDEFPSPESLKKRVLISTKPPERLQKMKSMSKKDRFLTRISYTRSHSAGKDAFQVNVE